MTGDRGEAEDALQEAYVRAWQHWPKISTYDNPEGRVRSVAFKLCVNAWWKTRNRLTAHRRAVPRPETGDTVPPGDLIDIIETRNNQSALGKEVSADTALAMGTSSGPAH